MVAMIVKREIEEETKVIVFRLQDEEYGMEINQVRSIERMQQITRLPNSPSFIKGIIHLRGAVIPVIDLRTRFALESREEAEQGHMIIIVSVNKTEVGLIVDAATDVIDIPKSSIESPTVFAGAQSFYLQGIAKLPDRLLVLLNVDQLLNQDEVQQLHQMERSI